MHPQFTPKDIARFWSHVDKNGPVPPHRPDLGPCWLWIGQPSQAYPEFKCWYNHGDRIRVDAHVASYEINVEPIPDGMFACHQCDTSRCVRPDHLFLGTAADNMRDMSAKGRARGGAPRGSSVGLLNATHLYPERRPRGSRHGRAILNEQQVAEIRQRYAARSRRRGEPTKLKIILAAEYGVSVILISKIVQRRLWAHI